MRCFFHRDAEAIGVCQSCHRGLCTDCYAEVGQLLACRNRCEEDVARWELIAHTTAANYAAARKIYFWSAVFLVLTGLPFVISALFVIPRDRNYGLFGLFIGVLFLLFSVILFRSARDIR